jgi:hypothetical protein
MAEASNLIWKTATLETRAMTLHAVYRIEGAPMAFGMKGYLNQDFVHSMSQFLNGLDTPISTDEKISVVAAKVGNFDACILLPDTNRIFMRGWAEEVPSMMHVFPVFSCELNENGDLPAYDVFRKTVDVFDINRQPEPYFTFKMMGGKSKLNVPEWGREKYKTFLSFVSVLANEESSTLQVRNRHGKILNFPAVEDWSDATSKIEAHLLS